MTGRILEVTNPIYHQEPQIVAGRKFYGPRTDADIYDGDFVSEGSRSMARGTAPEPEFKDRLPYEAPVPLLSHEPDLDLDPKPTQSSLWIADEHPDARLWHIIDLTTGHVFARVRGSLPWVVGQVRLAADRRMCLATRAVMFFLLGICFAVVASNSAGVPV